MPSSSALTTPPQLAKFPLEVREAYARYQATRSVEAVHVVVLAALRDFLPKQEGAPERSLADHLRLMEDLGYDSLAVAETVFFLEDLFQVRIGNRELIEVNTVGQLRNFVARKLAEKAAPA